jgi:membrane-associated phospholipid phosphatase
LGVDLNVWLQAVQTPLLNEWMMFGYFAYYPLIPLLAFTLYFQRRTDELNMFVTAATIAFSVSYIGFILYPVEGPRYFLAEHFSGPLRGYVFVPLVRWVIEGAAIHGGCMPSSHVAASWVVLIWAYRTQRRIAWVLTPIILTLTAATVWGRFHYFTDVLVGLPVGLGAVYLADYVWRAHWSLSLERSGRGRTPAMATAKTMGGTERPNV